MRVVIRADDHLARYGNQLGSLGAGEANRLMSMALNAEGSKGRTRVYAALMQQTGIRKHAVTKAVRTIPSTAGRLQFKLEAAAYFTNVSMFGLKVGSQKFTWGYGGIDRRLQVVSSAPWNVRRTFPGAFSIKRFGKRVFKRTSDERFPLKPVYGPNLAREIVKAQSRAAFDTIAPRVGVEVGRLLGLVMSGAMKLGTSRGFAKS